MIEGTPAETTAPVLSINRRRLEHVKRSWDLRRFLDPGETSFLLRMAEGFLRPPAATPQRSVLVSLGAEAARAACELDVIADALPVRQKGAANEIRAVADRIRAAVTATDFTSSHQPQPIGDGRPGSTGRLILGAQTGKTPHVES